ncbi:MAG: phosphatase PAP2 family protein [Gammaproteobacteria bacterium]
MPTAVLVFALAAAATAIAVAWLDRPLALAIARLLPPGKIMPLDVPDLLIEFVGAVTFASLLLWIWAWRRGGFPRLLRLMPLIAVAEPLALGLKFLSKWLFGRTQARLYINHPWAHDFHWWHGHGAFLGFPSGHMLVTAALITVIVAVYPRLRLWGWLVLVALGIALMLTSYHYLGDVIAGWLIGAALAWLILAADARIRPGAASRTPI